MKKTASSVLKDRLSPKKTPMTGLYDERLPGYIEIVKYLLTAYATSKSIARAIKESDFYEQAAGVPAALYAKRVYNKAQCYRIVYKEKRVM